MNFKKYLDSQIARKDRVGVLAKKLKNRKETSYEGMYSYLYSVDATEEEILALRTVFQEFNEIEENAS